MSISKRVSDMVERWENGGSTSKGNLSEIANAFIDAYCDAQAIIDKLPKTADGVSFVRGNLWFNLPDGTIGAIFCQYNGGFYPMYASSSKGMLAWFREHRTCEMRLAVCDGFSTKAAALAAKEKK